MNNIIDPSTGQVYKGIDMQCDCGNLVRVEAPDMIDLNKPDVKESEAIKECSKCHSTLKLTVKYAGGSMGFKISYDYVDKK